MIREGWTAVANKETPGFDHQRLRALREQAQLSTRQVSDLTDIGQSAIVRYETGQHTPSAPHLMRLARVFGVGPLDLVDRQALGHGLLALRVAVGLTQHEVADKAGPDISRARYRNLESGATSRLREADALVLAAIFAVSAEEVVIAHRWSCGHKA